MADSFLFMGNFIIGVATTLVKDCRYHFGASLITKTFWVFSGEIFGKQFVFIRIKNKMLQPNNETEAAI